MTSSLDFQTRRALLLQMVPRYHKASMVQKGALLDEIAATTGYARRYAMWLLNHPEEIQVRGWLEALPQMPTTMGTLRSPNTIESYARSVRAFCQWLVQHQYLSATPFQHLSLPPVEQCSPLVLESEEWEQLLVACHPPKETGACANRAAARNRAILWVLFETGMHATELCQLRLGDVDREQGIVRIRGKGATVRCLSLGQEGWRHLLIYLDHFRIQGAMH